MGPEEEDHVFLIDTGVTRTYICKLPRGVHPTGVTIKIRGVKGIPFDVPLLKNVQLSCGKCIICLDVIFVLEVGLNLLGRDALSLLGCELGIQIVFVLG